MDTISVLIIALCLVIVVLCVVRIYLIIKNMKGKNEKMSSKYESQQKHLRKNYVHFGIDLKPEVLEEFRTLCKNNGSTPTTELKRFIAEYCEANRSE